MKANWNKAKEVAHDMLEMKNIFFNFRYVRITTLISIIIGITRICASFAFIWISKILVDRAVAGQGGLRQAFLMMVAIMLFQTMLSVLASHRASIVGTKIINLLRRHYYSLALGSRWGEGSRLLSGEIINRLMDDVRIVVNLISSTLVDVCITCFQVGVAGYLIIEKAPTLLWILAPASLLAAGASFFFLRRTKPLTSKIRETDSAIQQHMQENLQHRPLVLTITGLEHSISSTRKAQDKLLQTTLQRQKHYDWAKTLINIGFISGYAATFYHGVIGLRTGAVSVGLMTALLQLVSQIQRPIVDMARALPVIINSTSSLERLSYISSLTQYVGQQNPLPDNKGLWGIRLQSVCYSYPDSSEEPLHELDYDIPPGAFIAIKGPTGTGKTTLTRLLLALLEPSSGAISLYGPRELPLSINTRHFFSYVPQGNSIMSGTIRENLMLALPEGCESAAAETMMAEALHLASADFAFSLPDGLDTRCGETGAGLSEGQCQRLAIARALLHDAPIIIFDEGLSALDAGTAETILKRLTERLKGRKTLIFITHHALIASYCDLELDLTRRQED